MINKSKILDNIQKSFESEDVNENSISLMKGSSNKISAIEYNLDLFLSNKSNKIAAKNVVIKEKEEEKEQVNKIATKNAVNILGENSQIKNDGLFSVTMTVYTDQSEIPQTMEFINKTNLIMDKIEGKVNEEKLDNKINKINSLKVTNVIEENVKDEKVKFLEENDLDNSIKDIFDNYKLSIHDFNSIENLDKFATLKINEDEAKKLENFFKNKHSIIFTKSK